MSLERDTDSTAASTAVYPSDINPESGFRLPFPRREDLSASDQATFDELIERASGRHRGRAGPGVGLRGPGGIALYSPEFARTVQQLNWYLRFESGIDGRLRELAILVAAREFDHQFEWTGHVPMALGEGLEQDIIDLVARRGSVEKLDEADAVVILLGRESISEGNVRPETFARALKVFGPRTLVDIVALMGNYVATGIMLTVFDMQLPPEVPGLLPPRPAS